MLKGGDVLVRCADFLRDKRAGELEPEASATAPGDPDGAAALLQAFVKQHQPGLEILGVIGQSQAGVEPELPVRELGPARVDVLAHDLPENRAGHPLDQVLVIEKDAVIA